MYYYDYVVWCEVSLFECLYGGGGGGGKCVFSPKKKGFFFCLVGGGGGREVRVSVVFTTK